LFSFLLRKIRLTSCCHSNIDLCTNDITGMTGAAVHCQLAADKGFVIVIVVLY